MNESEIEYFEAPKVLGDVFESVIGAIFVDGGLTAVMEVFKHIISPLLLFVAKFSKEVCKEPKEQFVIKAQADFRIKPKFYIHDVPELIEVASRQLLEVGTDLEGKPLFQQRMTEASMYRCDILYRKGKILCSGFGSSKRQAERNAGVEGMRWCAAHPELRKKELLQEIKQQENGQEMVQQQT